MTIITAKEALEYAFSKQMILLYLVIIVGTGLAGYGAQILADASLLPWRRVAGNYIFGSSVFITGSAAVYGGFIALIYKVVADANRQA